METISDQLVSLWLYLIGPELWIAIGHALLKVFIIIILASFIVNVAKRFVNRIFKRHDRSRISERREETLKKLMESIISYVVYFIAIIMVLEAMNLPISSLLAGAGVAGLAIGFGAQSLVKDIISGFFIVFEDQFAVGDYIDVTDGTGTVIEIGLRTTKIQNWTGELFIIPNGNIERVTNYSTYNGLAVVDINIPYESDISVAEQIISDVIITLPEKYDEILSVPVIFGVQSLELSHVVIRVTAETLPVYQWSGARIIRQEIKERLYKEGIDIPAPRVVMYSRDKQSSSVENENK